jgi:hypothetical protein
VIAALALMCLSPAIQLLVVLPAIPLSLLGLDVDSWALLPLVVIGRL